VFSASQVVDANASWSLETALAFTANTQLRKYGIVALEQPFGVGALGEEWRALIDKCRELSLDVSEARSV
jgi:L-alanine-DL-glutamate epimerase-like enolase superfamily enzyme